MECYKDASEHFLDELRWLNRLLAAHVLRLRQRSFHEKIKDFRDFFIADEEIDALLQSGVFEKDDASHDKKAVHRTAAAQARAAVLREEINSRLAASEAEEVVLPLVNLKKIFGLNDFEVTALLICLAPPIDSRYEKLYAYMQNDMTKQAPTRDFIFDLLDIKIEERLERLASFHPASPLRYFNLLEEIDETNRDDLHRRPLRANCRIAHYVLNHRIVDERLIDNLRFLSPLAWNEIVIQKALRDRLDRLMQTAVAERNGGCFYFYGRSGVGKKVTARAMCGDAGLPLAVVDLTRFVREEAANAETFRLVLREGLLGPCAVCFDHFESLEKIGETAPDILENFAREINGFGWVTFIISKNPPPFKLLDLAKFYPVEIPFPDDAAQKHLWRMCTNNDLGENGKINIERLTSAFQLTGGQISRAFRLARQTAAAAGKERGDTALSDLMASSRTLSQPRLSVLARKIDPRYQWDDIVLPPDQLRQLRELTNQVKASRVVMNDWGFGKKLSLGRGVSTLFAGPSGTGKTMAAEIIANALDLDLYKIDLSSIVSKYIGETEKNLNRVFGEAEHSNAILFFDEADALFGKRSEVKDAHDRYANIEVAYLLQKMEEYNGVTILATNFRKNIDGAFVRRIRFIIEFPFPDEQNRLKIWRSVWPGETPLAPNLDLGFIAAQFKLSGGNIRNVALAAAFLATENGKIVAMKHLLQATKREFQKMGKRYHEAEAGRQLKVDQPQPLN